MATITAGAAVVKAEIRHSVASADHRVAARGRLG
jgi:hypothetical protein